MEGSDASRWGQVGCAIARKTRRSVLVLLSVHAPHQPAA
ncbi:hypothetical protein XOC_3979 [Xanthomonas oryzae pv. oryzicola BLS256]|uniref:Uncharacterized protein n=1 Tax=Xanthomonas oryzae pv. oryzicola (strain BLS256) TaxID=383407 RepID=G7THT2_XANOB|nr:hypothetical protein XOC_3979 [Xanthomonas oryzae pv. oryzicola BLS256]